MKKKTTGIIIGVVAAVAVIAAVCIIAFSGGKSPEAPSDTTEITGSDVTVGDIRIDDPETDVPPVTETTLDLTEIPDDGNALTIKDEPMPEETNKSGTQGKAGQTAAPVTEKTPKDDGNGGGISIGGGQTEKYDCGTPGHHCDGPETHAYVLNLELEGCPYCGKSDCPSFYAVDQWGNTCYTPSKCPKYDVHKDPVYYCQDCGRKCGDGSNGTCVQFVNACNCPNCGKWVEAWTCHTCN